MLKDADKKESTAHFSYNEYKKKVKKGPNKDLTVFISVFIVGVLIILGFAKILSPNVDVGISDDTENAVTSYEDSDSQNSVIDERLKRLQMEDAGKKVSDENMFSPELDEKVVLPHHSGKTVGQMEAEMADYLNSKNAETKVQETHQQTAPKEQKAAQTQAGNQPSAQTSSQATTQIVNAKVVVGYYATDKQAEVAKSIIQDAGLGVTPIVKNMNGYYTLQVGSYNSREKAQQAANSLLKSNFPARVIVE